MCSLHPPATGFRPGSSGAQKTAAHFSCGWNFCLLVVGTRPHRFDLPVLCLPCGLSQHRKASAAHCLTSSWLVLEEHEQSVALLAPLPALSSVEAKTKQAAAAVGDDPDYSDANTGPACEPEPVMVGSD